MDDFYNLQFYYPGDAIFEKMYNKYYPDLDRISKLYDISYLSFMNDHEKILDFSFLQYPAKNGHIEVIKFLVEEKNIIYSDGTAILCAAEHGHLNIIEYFVKTWDNINSHFYIRAYYVAKKHGHQNILLYLEDKWEEEKKRQAKYKNW